MCTVRRYNITCVHQSDYHLCYSQISLLTVSSKKFVSSLNMDYFSFGHWVLVIVKGVNFLSFAWHIKLRIMRNMLGCLVQPEYFTYSDSNCLSYCISSFKLCLILIFNIVNFTLQLIRPINSLPVILWLITWCSNLDLSCLQTE